MRIILGTNVLLSGMLTAGLCERLLDDCVESDEVVVVLSERILSEFARHAAEKFRLTPDQVARLMAFLRANAEVVAPAAVPAGALRDPDDLPVLGTALAGGADCLVTGDRDLLTLGEFQGVTILSPRAFVEAQRGGSGRRGPSRVPFGLASESC